MAYREIYGHFNARFAFHRSPDTTVERQAWDNGEEEVGPIRCHWLPLTAIGCHTALIKSNFT